MIEELKTNLTIDYQEHLIRFVNEKLRHVYLTGGIANNNVLGTLINLEYLNGLAQAPIELRMNTFGGEVVPGLSLYDSIREISKTSPVSILATGACMSMGTIILQAGVERLSHPHTQFLLHKLRAEDGGTLDDLEDRQKERVKMQERLNEILIERTGIPVDELSRLIRRKDYQLTADEALKLNLIDRIV